MTVEQMLDDTAAHGGTVFQICDYAPIDEAGPERLAAIRAHAESLGIVLELGTRGTEPEHLRRQLRIATALGATLLRSMWTNGEDRPDAEESERRLRQLLPELDAAGVNLALETYEQVPSADLVALVDAVGHPRVGICLDPANTVANLELPGDVVARCARRTLNWHVKDFDFSRNPGWVGFVYTGTALGQGRLDYDHVRELVRPAERGISQIVEFWLPWADDVPEADQPETTARREAEWTRTTMEYLRSKNNV
ncbi:sugar phosphate isomerase/epimerase [Mycetocola reblochoni]|nr:sugar phosphate isomerase/epimerase [Mycetocola reblochoni]